MGKAIFIFLGPTIVLFSYLSALADDTIPKCEPNSYPEFVRCAEKISPGIILSEQQLKTSSQLEAAAGQFINPELEAESVSKGSTQSETSATLLFTIRLGGKRNALLEEAKAEVLKTKATHDLRVGESRLEIMLSMYRLSHLRTEISLEEESVSTFSKIVKQYAGRVTLSPEQDVSLSVFNMALADHNLRLSKLKADEDKINQNIFAATGVSREAITKSLPTRKEVWPELSPTPDIEDSPQYRIALAEMKLANSLKSKVDSEAWPDLKVGPSIRSTKEGNENNTFVGFSLSMPLPVLTQNGGAKAVQAQKVIESELTVAQSRKQLLAKKNELTSLYQKIVQSLKATLSNKSLNENHEKIERQFFKGLISSSLVIEAHRQLIELEERRNTSELEALEAYGQLLILENKFNEVIL